MTREPQPFDITHLPELNLLVEEVRASNQARLLQRNDETVAVLMPASQPPTRSHGRPRQTNDAVLAALRASAGSWKGIDTEQLKQALKEARGSDRPDATL